MGKKNFLKHALSREKHKVLLKKSKKGWIAKGITLSSALVLGLASPVTTVLAVADSPTDETVEVEKIEPIDSMDSIYDAIESDKADDVSESDSDETSANLQVTEDSQAKNDVSTQATNKETSKKETKASDSSKTDKSTKDVQKTTEKKSNVDKTRLQIAVDTYSGFNEDDYYLHTWAPFHSKLGLAKGVLNKEDATQAEVDQATNNLIQAMLNLDLKKQDGNKVNKDLLKSVIDMSSGLEEDDYIFNTWVPFQSKLGLAKGVLNNPNATQEQIDKAADDLGAAFGNLELKPTVDNKVDKNKLQNIINFVSVSVKTTIRSSLGHHSTAN
ncbi:FIVAR domain-containing protein [Vagococcus acidifermentans]|uniref:Uncharacterized protein n=1 Tax=Vagococcus acidifermentans TaxID=564710 RepID=A0A430AXP2_9ENTE|nr:FIVAR domain-containing protein [Vagococcus acidifermentans]RSU12819.1 hypothetical protein CBF27_04590 [Vagococcus acidifermentans]